MSSGSGGPSEARRELRQRQRRARLGDRAPDEPFPGILGKLRGVALVVLARRGAAIASSTLLFTARKS